MPSDPEKPIQESSFTDNYLLFLLAQASAVASVEFHRQLNADGIAVSTWRILASLHPNLKLTVGTLAQKCLLKQPTLTRTLDRLEKDGLVKRTHSQEDRREVYIELTKKGKNLCSSKVSLAKSHEDAILSGYSPQQIQDLKNSLRRLMRRNN